MKVAANITELIGRTPIVRLNKLTEGLKAEVLVKIESFNPCSSIKDRIGLSMVEDAENRGVITEGTTIIEPTSGNTGIALAYICAQRGYKLILTMPETMSIERRKLLKIFGAEIVLTEGSKGMKGSIDKAQELKEKIDNSIILQQFENSANPDAHRRTTALEIWNDTDGKIDIFVAGVGTGGTLTGVGETLKQKKSNLEVVAVEPATSAVISGEQSGPHKIQGIGAGFIPDNLHTNVIDNIIKVDDYLAGKTSRELAKKEGILAGISAGANVYAALELAKKPENEGKTIVTVLPDTGERYLSTWLFEEE